MSTTPNQPAPSSGDGEQPVLEGRNLIKDFRSHGASRRQVVHAVADVSIQVFAGRVTGIVGESGSGKSTLLRLLSLLEPVTKGSILLHGNPAPARRPGRHLNYRSDVQLVFQDPFASLNPARTIGYHVERPLRLHAGGLRRALRREQVRQLLERVSLVPANRFLDRYPHELSGGQRQRVAIARTLAVKPAVLLADEPVSMLDVSMQVDVLNLLDDLRATEHLGILYVTHNIASARYLAHTVNVMYAGTLVEGGPAEVVTDEPAHPYTQLLMRSTPNPARRGLSGGASTDIGDPPNLIDPPTGCPFHTRCSFAMPVCSTAMPPVLNVGPNHWARCWLHDQHSATHGTEHSAGSWPPGAYSNSAVAPPITPEAQPSGPSDGHRDEHE